MSQSFSVSDHYARALPVYRELGRLDGALVPGNADKTKWYINDNGSGNEWDGRARPVALSADIDDLDIDRTLYVSVNYAPADYYVDAWERYKWIYPDDPDDTPTREWEAGDNPMPDYADLSAIAPFADVDLLDDVKRRRPDGDAPTGLIETALDGYIEGFAELCGGRGPVHALDSVGGAYIMVAPSVTLPITEQFDGEDKAVLLQELANRLNDHLKDVRDQVSDDVAGHDDVLDPDMVNHKNRIHKAPLSLHSDLDGVVTPVDTDAPAYDFTRLDAVNDELRARAKEWAKSYTADYTDRVGQLVARLWGGSPQAWADTLEEWLDEQRTEETPSDGSESTEGDGPSITGRRTAPIAEVYRELDDLDVEAVADDTIVDDWTETLNDADDNSKDNHKAIVPTWANGYDSGNATYIDLESQIFHDTDAGTYGTVVEMALISETDWSHHDGIAEEKDWIRGIRELNQLDFDVPLPEGDVDDDMSQYYALDLTGIAADNGVEGDPYDDRDALLKACLYAREETPDVADEKPPYAALVAVADHVGLDMEDAEENILGKTTYNVARRVFDDLEPSDV